MENPSHPSSVELPPFPKVPADIPRSTPDHIVQRVIPTAREVMADLMADIGE